MTRRNYKQEFYNHIFNESTYSEKGVWFVFENVIGFVRDENCNLQLYIKDDFYRYETYQKEKLYQYFEDFKKKFVPIGGIAI